MTQQKQNSESTGVFREMLSGGNGIISVKRCVGFAIIAVCLGCFVYLVVREGGSSIVEHMFDTLMIVAGTLVGLSGVNNIAKSLRWGYEPETDEHRRKKKDDEN